MKNVLVTGGAGYIGSHCCKELHSRGFNPITFDNLVYGYEDFVRWGDFYRGDLANPQDLTTCFKHNRIDAVIHFAAYAYVGESVTDPLKYYENNVGNTIHLLQAALAHEVRHFIFSSSCATYGIPESIPIDETHPLNPINPYGRTKQMIEVILKDCDAAYGLRYNSLRYFNAAGADPQGEVGEKHNPETHLIPLVLDVAAGKSKDIKIFGNDYPLRTEPVSGTTFMSPTWPGPTYWHWNVCWTVLPATFIIWVRVKVFQLRKLSNRFQRLPGKISLRCTETADRAIHRY
jgi:UDP-glucose 4-epimerase